MSSGAPSISICIPACNRPELLQEALNSAIQQTLPPCEIVIGDDSRNDGCEQVVTKLRHQTSIPLVYKRNIPPLRQPGNINMLFEAAQGELLVLLHDDDLLLPNATADLADCWAEHPDLTAAYGKQYVMSHSGHVDEEASARLNASYFRSPEWAGQKLSAVEAGILQQFPNDCYMIRTAAARSVKWRSREFVGDGCEYDFGLRLCSTYSGFYFLDAFTAKYRLTEQSMSNNRRYDAGMQTFLLLRDWEVPSSSAWAKLFQLKRIAPSAVSQMLNNGRVREAASTYFGPYYPLSRRFSFFGLKQFARILLAAAGADRRTGSALPAKKGA